MGKCTKIFIFLYVFTLIFVNVNCNTCKQHSPCVCVYDDDRKVDLSSLSGKGFIYAVGDNYTYYFHPCTNKKPDLPSTVNKTNNGCDSTSVSIKFIL